MAWNGLGVYVLPPAFSPEVNGTIIDAVRYNGLTSDVANGITACLNKNGENVPTTAISWGGQRLTNLATASAAGDALSYGAEASVSNLWLGNNTTGAVGSVGIGPTLGHGSRMIFSGDAHANGGKIHFITGEAIQAQITRTPSAVNYLNFSGNITGNRPYINAYGTDTNVGLAFLVQGTGDIFLGQVSAASVLINTSAGQNRYLTIGGSVSPAYVNIGTSSGFVQFSEGIRNIAGGVSTANSVAVNHSLLGNDKLCFVDSTQPANGRQTEFIYTGGTLTGRFFNDAYTTGSNWLIVTGSSAGIAGIAFGGPLVAPTFSGVPAGTITSGVYTPTLTNSINCSTLTVVEWQYQRIGNIVTVQGVLGIGCTTAAATASAFYATLPIASDLAASGDLSGLGNRGNTGSADGLIGVADTTGNRANFAFPCSATAQATTNITFSYKVL